MEKEGGQRRIGRERERERDRERERERQRDRETERERERERDPPLESPASFFTFLQFRGQLNKKSIAERLNMLTSPLPYQKKTAQNCGHVKNV